LDPNALGVDADVDRQIDTVTSKGTTAIDLGIILAGLVAEGVEAVTLAVPCFEDAKQLPSSGLERFELVICASGAVIKRYDAAGI
jgi:hypothetical protein